MANSATVKDLKLAVKRKTEELQGGRMGHRQVSWYGSFAFHIKLNSSMMISFS